MKSILHAKRFRGLWPVVVDVETTGLDPDRHALLEVAAVFLEMDDQGQFSKGESCSFHIEPFLDAKRDERALEVTGIDPDYPLRYAIPETQVLHRLFELIQAELAKKSCYRACLVGHNAWFDLSFLLAAAERSHIKEIPFHRFTVIDTASLSAVFFGETVLARALRRASIPFAMENAHAALYDADRTAELFCVLNNRMNRRFF